MLKKSLLALGFSVGLIGAAYAAGAFSNYPGIGVTATSNCTSFGNNGVCNQYQPAGPTGGLTGTETIPADTNYVGGNQPFTITIPVTNFGAGAITVVTSPATATIPNDNPYYFLNGAQGSAFTITMPSAPAPGDIQRIVCTAATVGVLTVAANTGQTLTNNPAAACVAGVGYAWVYDGAAAAWRRFQ